MSASIRLSAYLFLPLLLSTGSFLALHALGNGIDKTPVVLGVMLTISLLLGLIPALLFRFFVHNQLRQGFAHMADGSVKLPHELGIRELAGDRIRHWQSYEQQLSTTVRLHGPDADLLVNLLLNLTLIPDEQGKQLAQHLDEALPLLERTVQECLYDASRMDVGLASALDGSTLLNEEDDRVLKSKFLCALETLSIEGVFFPHAASGIHIDRNVSKERHAVEATKPSEELEEGDLVLDDSLLESAGML
jgi:hypothetical protein